jgi:hypothetical protein
MLAQRLHAFGIPRTREARPYPRRLRLRYMSAKMSPDDFGGSRLGERENRAWGRRRLAAVGLAISLALVGAGAAGAASPQRIYQDLADNGRLDAVYSRADIERALNPGQVLGTDARTPASRQRSLERPLTDAAPPPLDANAQKDGRRVPFSALDVALLIAGGGPLLLIGAGLRRRLAPAPSQAPAASA